MHKPLNPEQEAFLNNAGIDPELTANVVDASNPDNREYIWLTEYEGEVFVCYKQQVADEELPDNKSFNGVVPLSDLEQTSLSDAYNRLLNAAVSPFLPAAGSTPKGALEALMGVKASDTTSVAVNAEYDRRRSRFDNAFSQLSGLDKTQTLELGISAFINLPINDESGPWLYIYAADLLSEDDNAYPAARFHKQRLFWQYGLLSLPLTAGFYMSTPTEKIEVLSGFVDWSTVDEYELKQVCLHLATKRQTSSNSL